MVIGGEEKVRVHMNVGPRSTWNTNGKQRINSEVWIKVLIKAMNNPLGVSPSKGNQRTTRGKETSEHFKVNSLFTICVPSATRHNIQIYMGLTTTKKFSWREMSWNIAFVVNNYKMFSNANFLK